MSGKIVALLLASKSEARRRMLQNAGVPFEIAASRADENAAKQEFRAAGLNAVALAEALALVKAQGVEGKPGDLVLGSDQTLELENGDMLDKPASRQDAAEQLMLLSGRRHSLHSAAALFENGEPVWQHIETVQLTMRPLSEDFLTRYLDAEYEAIRWGVGGYRIEGMGAQLFERIEGSHFAILGLPLLPLLGYLRERGVLPS